MWQGIGDIETARYEPTQHSLNPTTDISLRKNLVKYTQKIKADKYTSLSEFTKTDITTL